MALWARWSVSRHLARQSRQPGAALGLFSSLPKSQSSLPGKLQFVSRQRVQFNAQGAQALSEEEANQKRWEESGGGVGSVDKWRWTLNWDQITDSIIVGSCPRTPDDLERLAAESGADAVLCLQSDLCMEAMKIEWKSIRQRAVEKGVLMTRVAVRDFDHNDQALMLPEAVRMLNTLLSMGKTVYVHCTAGINRATLTVLAYLTFVQGSTFENAHRLIKEKRSQAHPYVDCWRTVRARLLHGRDEEIAGLAKSIYRTRKENSEDGDGFADWVEAENMLIRETFQRQLGCSLSLLTSMADLQQSSIEDLQCYTEIEVDEMSAKIDTLRTTMDRDKTKLRQALFDLKLAKAELSSLKDVVQADPETSSKFTAIEQARSEVASFRAAVQEIVRSSSDMLSEPVKLPDDMLSEPVKLPADCNTNIDKAETTDAVSMPNGDTVLLVENGIGKQFSNGNGNGIGNANGKAVTNGNVSDHMSE